jgi:hypothetical protein
MDAGACFASCDGREHQKSIWFRGRFYCILCGSDLPKNADLVAGGLLVSIQVVIWWRLELDPTNLCTSETTPGARHLVLVLSVDDGHPTKTLFLPP